MAMNFVPENRNGHDPFFDKQEESEGAVVISDHLLFALGQLSVQEYTKVLY